MKKFKFRTKAEQKLNKERSIQPLPHFPFVGFERLPKIDTSVVDSMITENLEKEITTLVKKLSDQGDFKVYVPKKLVSFHRIHFASTEEADSQLWALIKQLPDGLKEKYEKIAWPLSKVVKAQADEEQELAKLRELSEVAAKLDHPDLFELKPAEFLMERSGDISCPDEIVKFLGTKRVGVNQEEEDKLWEYLDGLPDWIQARVTPFFGRIKDVFVHPEPEDVSKDRFAIGNSMKSTEGQ